MLNQQAGMNRLVVNALLAVLLDDVQEVVGVELLNRAMHAFQRLIDGHRADRHRRSVDDRRADLIEIDAAGGEVHHRVSAVFHRQAQLGHLLIEIGGIGGSADVGVHLAATGDADRHRLQIEVVDVGRDDHPPPGHLLHHQRFGQVFPLGHIGHFFGHHALAGIMHLGIVRGAATLLDPGATHVGLQIGRGAA